MKTWLVFLMLVGAAFLGIGLYVFGGEGGEEPETRLLVSVDPEDEKTVIFTWHGGIDPPMAREMSAEFDKWKGSTSRVVIDLNSPGGSVDEGDQVIAVMKKMLRTHSVWTYVGENMDCLSMCVPIYLQGRMRVASPTSRWLFHDAQIRDKITGASTVMYSNERGQANLMFLYKYIDRSEIDREWGEKLKASLRYGDVWKTGQELKDERSNIVTVLE